MPKLMIDQLNFILMRVTLTLLFAFTLACLVAIGQRAAIELTFTAVNNTTHVQLDSIKIMNRTQGGDTVLIWPDTVLVTSLWVGVNEPKHISGFRLHQNCPNPVGEDATINLSVPEQDQVNLIITDVLGKILYSRDVVLSAGTHALLFTPGKESAYFLSAIWRGEKQTIKIVHYGTDNQRCFIEYTGLISSYTYQKSSFQAEVFIINPGDELLYIGYAAGMESGMLDTPEESGVYTCQFTTSIPCPGTPTVEYEGQVYNTIQIFSQCWLKENLNVGEMIPGTLEQSNNLKIEKYCYNNEPDSCDKYGGFYQWNEMMKYSSQYGVQGICPPGWHLPTDEEWKVLEGAVDSQYGIGDPEWDIAWEYRGYDAGTILKATSGWNYDGNGTDLFGFSGLPGGFHGSNGVFSSVGGRSFWWTSSEYDGNYSWYRDLGYDYTDISRIYDIKGIGFSVRCLMDE